MLKMSTIGRKSTRSDVCESRW